MMKTSPAGRKFIEQFEGLFLHTYNDGVGVATIGYGHTSAAGPPQVHYGMVITEAQADQFLAADLASVEADVNRLVVVAINQNQFDALVSFHFNTGALGRSNVLRAINTHQNQLVPGDLMMWCHAGGRVLAGLVRRRKAEGVMFMAPVLTQGATT
jgi:lysozyme